MTARILVQLQVPDDDGRIVTTYTREDLRAAFWPRPGDTLARHTLGDGVNLIVGGPLTVHTVEHTLAQAAREGADEPTARVIVLLPTGTHLSQSVTERLHRDGWKAQHPLTDVQLPAAATGPADGLDRGMAGVHLPR